MVTGHARGNREARHLALCADQTVSIAGERGTVVRCRAGRMWITQEGDAQDYVVPAGAHYRSAGAGRIVASALADGTRILVLTAQAVPDGGWSRNGVHLDGDFIELAHSAARQEMARCIGRLGACAWRRIRALWRRTKAPGAAPPSALASVRRPR